ncbi:hypothetical protein HY493_04745 [Candidatus Woesearchaeota archaeon]|nr:hypothetical protein [Candidatus Woesearchaeota archaeon]
MVKGETLDIKIDTPVMEVQHLLEAIAASKEPAQKAKRTAVLDEDVLRYLPAALPQYVPEEKKEERIIITPLVNEWAFQDTNGFDPNDKQAVFRLPAAVVYVMQLPVAREWHKTAASLDINENPFSLNGQSSEFFIATKGYLNQKDFGSLFN